MKKITLLIYFITISIIGLSQEINKPIVTKKYRKIDYQKYRQAFSNLDSTLIQTGFLADKVFQMVKLSDYNGSVNSKTMTYDTWEMLYTQIQESQIKKKLYSKDSILFPFIRKNAPYKTVSKKEVNSTKDRINSEEFVPISILNIEYSEIKKEAFSKRLLKLEKGKLKETSLKSKNSPYQINNLFAASALKKQIYNGQSVNFLLDESFYFSNKSRLGKNIEVDFDDGFGFRKIKLGESISVNYSTIGKKRIMIKEKNSIPSRYTSRLIDNNASFEVNVEALYTPTATFGISLDVPIPSGFPHGGVNIQGTGYVYTSDGSQNIRKPLIVCEGFDPLNERGWNELYTLLNQQNLIECLKSNGYDVIVLNFNEGATYIERNAYLLMNLINRVNSIKTTQNKTVIVGASMGGLVTRYALSYMEKNNINHDTRLFISFDSPQQGANIPLGAQYWLKFFSDMSGEVKSKYNNILCSVAAKQMLVYHSEYSPDPTNNPYRIEFLQNLNALGYPNKLRKIAIANGAGNAYSQRKDDGSALNPTNQIIGWRYRDFWTVDIDGNSYALPNISPNTTIFYGDVEMSWIAHVVKWDFSDGSLTVNMENSHPYDNAPGGTSDATRSIAAGDTDGYGDITTSASNHCFIPTISSLAINTTNVFYNISGDPNILSKTPFEAIYYPTNVNEKHINISSDCVGWVRNELVPQNLVLSGPNISYWNTGDMQASNSISIGPGFATVPGKGFHAFLSPLQACSPSYSIVSSNYSKNDYIDETLNNNEITNKNDTNIDDKKLNEEIITIFPNPNNGKFYISIKNADNKSNIIVIRNTQGAIIYQNLNNVYEEIFVDISSQPKGLYFVSINQNGTLITKKIIKY